MGGIFNRGLNEFIYNEERHDRYDVPNELVEEAEEIASVLKSITAQCLVTKYDDLLKGYFWCSNVQWPQSFETVFPTKFHGRWEFDQSYLILSMLPRLNEMPISILHQKTSYFFDSYFQVDLFAHAPYLADDLGSGKVIWVHYFDPVSNHLARFMWEPSKDEKLMSGVSFGKFENKMRRSETARFLALNRMQRKRPLKYSLTSKNNL